MEETLKILEKIGAAFGPVYGTLVFILLIGLVAILYFFQKRIDNIAGEISKKALSAFEKKITLLFRDETIRGPLKLQLAQDSIKKKMEIYLQIYTLYFEYQKSWLYSSNTSEDEINSLSKKILAARETIFINSIYLGGYLSGKLIQAVVHMYADLKRKVLEVNKPSAKRETTDYVMIILDSLEDARKWLDENVFPDQTMKEYEFSNEQIATLNEERKKILENIKIN